MDMQGQRVLHVTQAQAWDALNDPEILKSCIPGYDKFKMAEANVYSVGVAIKIGPVSAKFSGKVTLSDIQAPNSYALNFEAQGGSFDLLKVHARERDLHAVRLVRDSVQ
ncbi:MAG: hypothetical protein EXR25_13690 [Limnohabitans sp.]|nr:hypothetical protein [Limnohabitans sp.]